MHSIVIIGGGHAGAQLCGALAEANQGGRVHLVCHENELPYHRPPLSKAFLKSADQTLQLHRAESWYSEAGITLHRGDGAVSVDRTTRTVRLASGIELPYEYLVIATGARPRRLPSLPPTLANVDVLRHAADALGLRAKLAHGRPLTVLGGGFIGLEIAATARALGLDVQVLESAPRFLARSVSPQVSEHVRATHEAAGIRLQLGVRIGEFEVEGDRLVGLQVDGERRDIDRLVLGIGAEPDTTLAAQAGLEVENGIVVDAFMRTSDPSILSIGDCTNFPESSSGRRLRLESVQNANDQARTAAALLIGEPKPYAAVPWFWSEQGALRLQMAGLLPSDTTIHRRNGAKPDSFSLFHYLDERLVCVESINAPMDHIMSRKLMEAGKSPPPEQVSDPAVALKTLV